MMSAGEGSPISRAAVGSMRRLRIKHGWSARQLADKCEEFGAAEEPPIPSTLSRSRIAKLESGVSVSMTVDELWLVAGAFGLGIEKLLGHQSSNSERLFALETAVAGIQHALDTAGIPLPLAEES